jgi:DNA-binding Lrp family transcriptional regulator
MEFKVDDIDKEIICEFVKNSKVSANTLAKKLKMHPNTLLQRIKRLEKNGVIQSYTTVVDYTKLGYVLQVMIFLNVKMDSDWEKKLRPVSQFPEVSSFMLLSGDYDAAAIVRVKDMKELADILRKIQATGIVVNTTSHMILEYYKYPHEFNRLTGELQKK